MPAANPYSPPTGPLSFKYVPRPAFVGFHNRRSRFAVLTCHRRSGKTVGIVNDLLIGALEEALPRPQFAYIAPTYAQAKRVAWEYLKDYAQPFLAEPPNESELRVTLVNNARIFLAGSDNFDSLRGLYLDGAAVDEYATGAPAAWTQVLLPALADRKGYGIIASTPKGKNHFYRLWNDAQRNDDWFRLMLRADTSNILDADELARMQREMPPDEYEQEFLCSFTALSKGAILFDEVERAEAEGRIHDDDRYDESADVFVAADIGFRDTAAFWFCQKRPTGRVAVIHYMENFGMDAEDWISEFRDPAKCPYPITELWLPHDAKARTFQTRNSAQETFIKANYVVRIIPRTSVIDRINAGRMLMQHCEFNSIRCHGGLEALREWTFEWDAEKKEFSRTPLHNWASHGGDAFTYLAQMVGNSFGTELERKREKFDAPAVPKNVGMHNLFTLEDLHADAEQARRRVF